MGYLLDTPPLHKFAYMRIFTRRGPQQLAVIHIRERLNVTHVKEYRYQLIVDRVIAYLFPGDGINKLGRQRSLLALEPLEYVPVCLKIHI